MNCYNHPNVPATATCADCSQPICAACTRTVAWRPVCAADYALREQHRLTPNFVYQHAAADLVQPQDTAAMLLQTEEAQIHKPEGKPRKAWEDTMIWAVIGLVCALIAVFLFTSGLDVYNGYGTITGVLGLNALLSAVSLIIIFWTILSRQDSSRPRYIIWIGLTSVIVLAILWISTPFLIHEKEQYLEYLRHLQYPDLYK